MYSSVTSSQKISKSCCTGALTLARHAQVSPSVCDTTGKSGALAPSRTLFSTSTVTEYSRQLAPSGGALCGTKPDFRDENTSFFFEKLSVQ